MLTGGGPKRSIRRAPSTRAPKQTFNVHSSDLFSTDVVVLMLRGAFVSLAIILLTACTVTPNSSTSLFIERLDRKVPTLLHEHREPGIAIAFVDGCMGSVRTYGLANREAAAPVRPNTVFNLGSVSKTFTAWTVMTLVEAGKVKLDDPADTYLSRWHLPESTFDRHAVTVRRLLNHTAGISIPSVSGVDRDAPVPSVNVWRDPPTGLMAWPCSFGSILSERLRHAAEPY